MATSTYWFRVPLWMPPSQESFETRDPIRLQVDQRLIEKLELSKHEGFAQIELKPAPGLHPGVHLRLKESVGTSSVLFGAVKCHVGALQKAIKVATVTWRKGNTHTCADDDLMAV